MAGGVREAELRAEYAREPGAHLHTAQQIAQRLIDTHTCTLYRTTTLARARAPMAVSAPRHHMHAHTCGVSHMFSCTQHTAATKCACSIANATSPSSTGTYSHVCAVMCASGVLALTTMPTSFLIVRSTLLHVPTCYALYALLLILQWAGYDAFPAGFAGM
jgi:hypothetical protein